MRCAYCEQELAWGEYVIRLTPVAVVPGRRTGRPTPEDDGFPDGTLEKFLHVECMDFAMQRCLSLDGPGHDLPSLQTGVLSGSPGYPGSGHL